jgi:hypothetical protein
MNDTLTYKFYSFVLDSRKSEALYKNGKYFRLLNARVDTHLKRLRYASMNPDCDTRLLHLSSFTDG